MTTTERSETCPTQASIGLSVSASIETVRPESKQVSPQAARHTLRQRISRNQAKVAALMLGLGLTGDPYLALAKGLERSVAGRVERLLADHSKFSRRFEDVIKECSAILKYEERQSQSIQVQQEGV